MSSGGNLQNNDSDGSGERRYGVSVGKRETELISESLANNQGGVSPYPTRRVVRDSEEGL